MPTYSFVCKPCQQEWDQYYSFDDFDKLVKPGKIKCPKCKKKAQDKLHAPNINVGNTIGAQAEKNNKRLGSYGLEAKIKADEDKRIKKKPKAKKPWYGQMPREKLKEIKNAIGQDKQNKIDKYIKEGK
jgi:hypothetical protein